MIFLSEFHVLVSLLNLQLLVIDDKTGDAYTWSDIYDHKHNRKLEKKKKEITIAMLSWLMGWLFWFHKQSNYALFYRNTSSYWVFELIKYSDSYIALSTAVMWRTKRNTGILHP